IAGRLVCKSGEGPQSHRIQRDRKLINGQEQELVCSCIPAELLRTPETADQEIVYISRKIVDYVVAREIPAEDKKRTDARSAAWKTRPPVAGYPESGCVDRRQRYLAVNKRPV